MIKLPNIFNTKTQTNEILIGIAKMLKYSCRQNTLLFALWRLGVLSVPSCFRDTEQ